MIILLVPILSLFATERYSFESSTLGADLFLPKTAKVDSLKRGDMAAMFVLRDLNTDNPFYLRDYTGKVLRDPSATRQVVVLSFWSSWCEPCKLEIPRLTKLAGEFTGKPVKFILINTMEDGSVTEDSIRKTYRARSYSLQCLLDATGRIAKLYNARVLPNIVVIDQHGVVRKVMQGFREKEYPELGETLMRLIDENSTLPGK